MSFGFFTAIIICILYGYKGIAIPVLIMIVVIVILWFVSRFTTFARYVCAVRKNNGLWSAEAEKYLLKNAKSI